MDKWRSYGLGAAVCALVAALLVASPAQAEPQVDDGVRRIVSLGDSYLAGNGNGNYYDSQGPGHGPAPDWNVPGDSRNCWQSHSSYPWQFVQMINDQGGDAKVWHAGCGGARLEHLRDQWATVPTNWVENGRTVNWQQEADVVLLSFGGNDLGFSKIAWHCILGLDDETPIPPDLEPLRDLAPPGTCDDDLDYANDNLGQVMRTLRDDMEWLSTQTSAHIVLVGYPNLLSPGGVCINSQGESQIHTLVANHQGFAISNTSWLNANVAPYRFHYVPVLEAFEGQGPCAPTVTYIHRNAADGEHFHPTWTGANTYARVLIDAGIGNLNAITQPDPGQPRQDVVIRSKANGQYVSAELDYTGDDEGMLRAREDSVAAWEEFTLVGDCRSQVGCAIQSRANGLYVSAELGYEGFAWGELRARESSPSAWEMFGIEGDCESTAGCSLRSKANGLYVSVELDYEGHGHAMLRARAGAASAWEMFYIGPSSTTGGSGPGSSGGSPSPPTPEYLCARGGPNVHCKDGISGAWVWNVADFADEVELSGDLLCVRGARAVYCKHGGLDASWTLVYNGADDVEISGDRICVRDGANLHCKDDGIHGAWVWNVADFADEVELSGDLLCVRGGRSLYCKDGALSASWTLLTRGADDVEISGGRICVRNGARLHCKDGGIFGGWVWNVATWANEVELSGNLLCARGGRELYCKSGALTAPWTLLTRSADDVEVSGDRICARNGQNLRCKEGIFGPWVWNVADWADEIDLG